MTPVHPPERRRRDDDLQAEVQRVATIVQTRLHPAKVAAWIAIASLLGAFLPLAAGFLGVTVFGPGTSAVRASLRIDSVEVRLGNIEESQLEMRELFTAYIASSCLDSTQVIRLRQALVPCRSLLDERGVLR